MVDQLIISTLKRLSVGGVGRFPSRIDFNLITQGSLVCFNRRAKDDSIAVTCFFVVR